VRGRAWTVEEIALLEREYKTCFLADIGKRVHRSRSSVKAKMRELGLAKQPGRPRPPRLDEPEIDEPEINIRINPIGKHERIPPMPGLLDHLQSMSGCMDTAVVMPHAGQRASLTRLEKVRPKLEEMLSQKVKYSNIAKEIGVSYYTVFEYAKKMRAAA
jgi:hypothetical protein